MGIAESEAERIERGAFEESIGPVRHAVVGEVRQIRRAAIKGDGKPAGRIDYPEKDIGNGCAAVLPRIPCLDDGVHVLGCPAKGDAATRHVDVDWRLSGS